MAVYLDYTIHLSDKALVEQLQAAASRVNDPVNDAAGTLRDLPSTGFFAVNKGRLYCSPERAALEFSSAPLVAKGEEDQRPANPPYITSAYIHPVGSDLRTKLPTNQDRFTVPITFWFFSAGLRVIWRGRYEYTPSEAVAGNGTPPGTPEAVRQRRWADGFELPGHGEGSAGGETTGSLYVTTDASRTPGGLGLRMCDPASGAMKTHTVNEFRAGLTTTKSWERIYFRINTLPQIPYSFLHFDNDGGGNNGADLQLLPSGAIAVCDVLSTNARTLLASTQPFDVGEWHRLDVLVEAGASARIRIFRGGVELLNVTGFSGSGFGVAGNHTRSQLGNVMSNSGATATICMDFDDWINADQPTNVDDADTLSIDWLNGSSVVFLRPKAFGPSHDGAAWSKTYQQLAARPGQEGVVAMDFSSALGTQPIFEVDLDVDEAVKALPRSINGGLVAITVGLYNTVAAGGANGQLSIARNGGAYADTNLTQNTTLNWDNAAYVPSGLAEPEIVNTLLVKYTPGASAHARTVRLFAAAAECIGIFGPEDFPAESVDAGLVPPPARIEHAHPYGRSPWAYLGPPPISPVIIKAGTYVGNGTTQQLSFREPVTWIHIRRVDVTIVNGAKWWSTLIGSKIGWEQPYSPEGLVTQEYRPNGGGTAGECLLTIASDQANVNAAGVTYQYVAFCDPGMRFSLNGVIRHHRGTIDRTTTLLKPAFTADAAFLTRLSSGGATTVSSYYKGPGHAAQSISLLNAAETANAFQISAGALLIRSAIMAAVGAVGDNETPFALFRRNDGSGDPGVVDTLYIGSYTGDGTASRTIAMPTTKRPLFALVVPHNGASIFRDPSHTGTTSHTIATGDTLTVNLSTGITGGGAGSISVGSALNSNGIVYDVFVILGCDTAGNNGWGPTTCESEPVVAAVPVDWPGETEPEEEEIEPEEGGGGGGGEGGGAGPGEPGGVDFGAQCVAASQKVCQQALSHIGVTELIDDVTTDDTPAATMCRLHYEDCVNEALREFPWDFATRYATLVHLDGSEEDPVNGDWAYEFELPEDCLFPRRLVDPRIGRKFDPDPPPWRQGQGTEFHRKLYTSFRDPETTDDDPSVELEYTYRPGCAATQGDSLFRQALTWLLASKLAPSLSRNKVTAADCWAMYLHTIHRAQTVNARAQQHEDPNGDPDWIRGRN